MLVEEYLLLLLSIILLVAVYELRWDCDMHYSQYSSTKVSRLKEEIINYQQELEKCTIQMEKFQTILETVMTKIEKCQDL
jgi:hypothetical protein